MKPGACARKSLRGGEDRSPQKPGRGFWGGPARVLLAVLLVVGLGNPAAGQPALRARAFALVEARTGQVLAHREAHAPWPPASTTKVLTALLVAESLRPEDVVTVSPRAAAQRSGATLGLRAGERRRVEELFYAMLLASANDASVALAEAAAGSVEGFVERMNERAAQLGARNTHFTNPHGLYDPRHRSTAYDLAQIARAALRDPWVARAVATREHGLASGSGPRKLVNRNRLLFTYPGANGVKTGWLVESGPCLVASARRDGRTLIAVLLDSPEVFVEAARLLDFGFAAFELRVLARPGQPAGKVRLPGGQVLEATVAEEVAWAVPRGAAVEVRVRWDPGLKAPVRAGQRVGWAEVRVDGREELRVPALALWAVQPRGGWEGLWRWIVESLGRR